MIHAAVVWWLVVVPVVVVVVVLLSSVSNPNYHPHYNHGVVHSFTITTTTTTITTNHHHYYYSSGSDSVQIPSMKRPRHSFSLLSSSSSTSNTNSNTNTNSNSNDVKDIKTSPSLQKKKKKGTIIVVGATGYIGKAVVRECLRQDYQTIALVRTLPTTDKDDTPLSRSAISVQCDVTNATQVLEQMQWVVSNYCSGSNNDDNGDSDSDDGIAAVVSCLASRSGTKSDAYLIDYQATRHCLHAATHVSARHFILLSAYCVQKPLLQFQQAKLKFEAALQQEGERGNIIYTIVRPTAFFKSVSGQLEVVQSGAPFVLFDKGPNAKITACNPIAESDLATYMIDSITTKERHNQIINLGGPDEPITMLQQGHMLFNATQKEPKFAYAPVWIFDLVINSLQFVADLLQNEKIADMAETGRIGKYYAVEDMVTTLPHEKYGTITLQEHYNRIAVEGNDYDPYTTMFARARGIDVNAIQNDMKNQNKTNDVGSSSTGGGSGGGDDVVVDATTTEVVAR